MENSSSIIWGALKKKKREKSRTNLSTESGRPSQQSPGLDVADDSPVGPGLFLLGFSSEILWYKRRKQFIVMDWREGSPGVRDPACAKKEAKTDS